MPSISTDIEFEMYCGICGSGCCADTEETTRRGQKTAFTMTCSTCEEKISNLEEDNRKLENECSDLEDEIFRLKQQLESNQ